MNKRAVFTSFFVFGTIFVFAASVTAKEQKCLDCHTAVASGKVVHPALDMGCESCHASPHAKKKPELSLVSAIPGLCYNCHDKGAFTKKTVHPPVKDGQCTFCHNPHSSDTPLMLTQPVADLCAQCHADKTEQHVLAGFGHGGSHPVKGKPDPSRSGKGLSCLSCHNPHSSSQKSLFTNESQSRDNLCLLCHQKVMVRP